MLCGLIHHLLISYSIIACVTGYKHDYKHNDLNNDALCPVSTKITGPSSSGLFSYPLNIYDPRLLETVQISSPNSLYNCSSIEINEQVNFNKFHKCSSFRTCPIHKANLVTALDRSSLWIPNQFYCRFKQNLHNPKKKSRIIILGGSVTAGQFASWFYCDVKFDSKCPIFKNMRVVNSWGHYIRDWFAITSPDDVTVLVLPTHGYSSANTNERILEKLASAGITSLSSSDMILLDHSYNDGLYLTKIKVLPLQQGLEGLIRKLYQYADSRENTKPTIVIMETLAYLPEWLPFYQDYQQIYGPIAKHYGLPIWSIRDAVNSEYCQENQPVYCKYLQHQRSVQYDLHPGWHVHLFYADMVAALLKLSLGLSHCPRSATLSSVLSSAAVDSLPSPLYNESVNTCNTRVKPLLDVSAYNVMNNLSIIGTWQRSADTVWMLKDEGRGRVGWVQEKQNMDKSLTPASLFFSLDDPKQRFGSNGDNPHLIQIQYLRTYENAGQVKIFVCGHLITGGDGMVRGNLDGLWQSFGQYKLSLPEFHYIVFPDFGVHCKNPNDTGIRIEYVSDIECNRDARECHLEKIARGHSQKFKLISMKVCKMEKQKRY